MNNDSPMADVLKSARNISLNMHLQKVDEVVRDLPDAATQMGILMMAQALAFRRLTVGKDHGVKNHWLKMAKKDFDAKIRAFGFESGPDADKQG